MLELHSRRQFLGTAAGLAVSAAVFSPDLIAEESPEQLWLNEPKRWRREGTSLICSADAKTDFWSKTFYGYTTDNGHLYYRRVKGDFTAIAKITGQYHDLYDQAGIMLRADASNWVKCGVELVDGKQNLSVVVTRDFSDWSTARLPDNVGPVWMKVVRKGPALDIFHSLDGKDYTECRVAYFGPADPVMVGLMCAAPMGNGFEVRFDDWVVQPA